MTMYDGHLMLAAAINRFGIQLDVRTALFQYVSSASIQDFSGAMPGLTRRHIFQAGGQCILVHCSIHALLPAALLGEALVIDYLPIANAPHHSARGAVFAEAGTAV